MNSSSNAEFLARAKHEAKRYGSDPWVLVRELLQNARDAGATRVEFDTSTDGGRESITCRDDGSGMTFDHARRYLFTLYASSKRDRRNAGRFGIGFWSVLRFNPDVIVIRSRPENAEGWEIRLDGSLESISRKELSARRGTEIVLERPAKKIDLSALVRSAVLRDAPFLTRRDRSKSRLDVLVDGKPVHGDLGLPPPSMSFSRRGLRGAVGLGEAPGVEIYSHGLRVREATSLDELVLSATTRRPAVPTSGEGFSPRVIMDSGRLSLLLARGDAREDRALKRLVAVGHRELRRLVGAELDRHVGASPGARIGEFLRHLFATRGARIACGMIAAALVFAVGLWFLSPPSILDRQSNGPSAAGIAPSDGREQISEPYRDLADRYHGPDLEGLGVSPPPIELQYRPPHRYPLFAALVVTGVDPDDRIDLGGEPIFNQYVGRDCTRDCLEVDLVIDAPAGWLRVPIATGHLIDASSVTFDGQPVLLEIGSDGLPVLRSHFARRGRLRYRSAPAVGQPMPGSGSWPLLPAIAEIAVSEILRLPEEGRVRATTKWVRENIAYDASPEVSAEHRRQNELGRSLFDRSLEIGGGDCDVQNALVTAMLVRMGVSARMAIGWRGVDGGVAAGLHAWVEYVDEGGRWRIADASLGSSPPSPIAGSPADSQRVSAPRSRAWLWVGIAMVLVVGILLARRAARPAWRRTIRIGDDTDLSELLRGAAARPESFARVPSVFSRPVVPLLAGRAVSLAGARRAANKGRLACGRATSELARRASTAGGLVVDLDKPEGAAVAKVLSAVDLDRWQAVLDRAQHNPVTRRVEEALAGAGDPCRVRVSSGLGEQTAVLDGRSVGLGGDPCWVVLDQHASIWRSVLRLVNDRPATAALLAGDAVVGRLSGSSGFRRAALGDLAGEALAETARDHQR